MQNLNTASSGAACYLCAWFPPASVSEPILVGRTAAGADLALLPKLANRHGLVAGATGTGKSVTLMRLAEGLSRTGVPVFLADVKGDLAGLAAVGDPANTRVNDRIAQLGLAGGFQRAALPVTFWDVFGEQGHPLRATVSEMGPLLLARLLGLTDVQEGVLNIVFQVADDRGLLLIDLKDLRALVQHVGDHAKDFTTEYGNISTASIGAIQRGLLTLDQQGGDRFFGEPALDLHDLMRTDAQGRGVINLLAADQLMASPKLYATFLLWLLAELFEELPEVGDPDQPKLVFFFDEAHLLFSDAPKALVDKVEQVVRLIRSKGVGVYFVTQNPLDVPDAVLGQLGNRVQHALRAFTPRDQKAVDTAADTFRPNPGLNVRETITALGVGEALVSFLDAGGIPAPVEHGFVVPPGTRIGPVTPDERRAAMAADGIGAEYDTPVDRESAYEMLRARAAAPAAPPAEAARPAKPAAQKAVEAGGIAALAAGAWKAANSPLGRQIVRGVMGAFFGGSRRR